MKASFAYGIGELAYLGGYYGDLSDYGCYNKWQESIKHMNQMLGLTGVDKTIGDLHPAYISAKEANVKIQHHYAHALSVMAEHGLKKALAVTFDGTGYGIDGAIWGGEFLLCDRQTESRNNSADEKETERGGGNVNTSDYKRIAHISPVRILGGDTSAKDCDIAAMSYIKEAIDRGYLAASDNPYADDTRWSTLSSAIDNNVNVIASTSMGRLFDAVSAMLGICTYNTYESEAPISLQIVAENWMRNGMLSKLAININYNESDGTYTADTVKLIANIVKLYNEGNDKGQLAFAFHKAVADLTVELIKCIYIERNIKNSDYPVTFSGGTMNNKLLLQLIIEQMRANALVYYINEQVEAGDGGLSLGQLYAVSNTIEF
jgi:hydrogenase maturation protein HypF